MRTSSSNRRMRGYRRPVVVALFLVLLAAGLPAQQRLSEERFEDWQAAQQVVSAAVSGVRVERTSWVTDAQSYRTDARIIHDPDQESSIEFPVDLSEQEWRERLDDFAYYVLREDGTERAFSNPMHNSKTPGIYYSRATGQPLFSSEDKYDSRTGWPSFTKPISPDAVAYFWDYGLFSRRIEVVDSLSGSHLGHVFRDGPEPTGQRYCMNAEALIFVPEGEDPSPMLTPADM
ncbi:MAG: peptide-methionine (R)-S-oxide reductase MsrB [Alkalispirochaetaceae bacterium]